MTGVIEIAVLMTMTASRDKFALGNHANHNCHWELLKNLGYYSKPLTTL